MAFTWKSWNEHFQLHKLHFPWQSQKWKGNLPATVPVALESLWLWKKLVPRFALTHKDQTGIEQVRGQVDFAETMEMENRNGKWKWKWECRKTVSTNEDWEGIGEGAPDVWSPYLGANGAALPDRASMQFSRLINLLA